MVRKYVVVLSVFLMIHLMMCMSQFWAFPLASNHIHQQNDRWEQKNRTITQNTVDDFQDQPKPGYYRVLDVYPSGERSLRGVSPIGTRIQPRQQKGYTQPLTSEYMWISGQQAVYMYYGFDPEDEDYRNYVMVPEEGSNYPDIIRYWDKIVGWGGYITSLPYGEDNVRGLLLPNADEVPVIISSIDGSLLYTFSLPNSGEQILCVVAGNFDNDAGYEVAFLCNSTTNNNYLVLRILDDWSNSFSELETIDIDGYIAGQSGYTIRHLLHRLKVYDIDYDGRDEIIIQCVVKYQEETYDKSVVVVLDDSFANFELIDKITHNLLQTSYGYYVTADVVAGDFDGDNNVELIIGFCVLVYYRYNRTSNNFEYVSVLRDPEGGYIIVDLCSLAAADVDFDYKDELIVGKIETNYRVRIYDLDSENVVSGYEIADEYRTGSPDRIFMEIFAENFDDDIYTEVAMLLVENYMGSYPHLDRYIYFYGDISENFERVCWWFEAESIPSNTISPQRPLAAMVPVSGDILIHYTGIHNTSVSSPYIIATMAAPPTVENISQNYGATATFFGTAVSQSHAESNGYSVSVGVTLSFEAEDIFKIVNVHASTKFSYEFEKTRTVSQTIQECREFSGDYSEDYVIFESVVYDNYYYEVVYHPNESIIGQIMAISIPNAPAVYKWTVDYFNSHNGDYPDIGEETFKHTIGDPSTYPSLNDMTIMESEYKSKGFWKSQGTMTIGSGYGDNSVEIDLETITTTETTRTIGVEYEAGISIFGSGLSLSTGLKTKYMYSISIGESTKYQGKIGDIAPEDYEDYKYSVGLFVYNLYRQEEMLGYQVLNYWIEDYNPPRESTTNETTTTTTTTTTTGETGEYKPWTYVPGVSKAVDKISEMTGLSPEKSAIVLGAAALIGMGAIAHKITSKGKKTKTRTTRKKTAKRKKSRGKKK